MSQQKDLGRLFLTQYRQLPKVNSAMHWGLYVAFTDQGTAGPGVLHHWNYSSNEAVTDAVIGCQGCLPVQDETKYRKGYLKDPKNGTRCERATAVSRNRVISSEGLDNYCRTVARMKYHWKDQNCQHFVQGVLKELKNASIISGEEYRTAMQSIIPSRFVPSEHNYTAASSSTQGAPMRASPASDTPATKGRKHHKSGHGSRSSNGGRPSGP